MIVRYARYCQVYTTSIRYTQDIAGNVTMEKLSYSVKELAKELGISRQTVLRYEKKGFFPKAKRNPFNKWRRYSRKDIEDLRKILEHGYNRKTVV